MTNSDSRPGRHFICLALSYLFFFLLFVLLVGCATQKPIVVSFPAQRSAPGATQPAPDVQMPSQQPAGATPPAPTPVPSDQVPNPAQNPQVIAVPLTQYNTPDNTPPAAPAASQKDAQQLVTSNNIQFEIKPQQEDYKGGDVEYNYIPNHVYQLFVAPLQLTTVMLEAGETIISAPAAGDTANFMLAAAVAADKGQQRPQLLIKAVYPGKTTTMSVNTDKRSYFFKVYSYDGLFMPLVSFNYPLDFAQIMKDQAVEAQNRILLNQPVTSLDFSYDIIWATPHRPHWAPDRVFSDGKRMYLSFPSASRASYAPVLFEVNSKSERVLLNYRVIGTYYIVDRVSDHLELVLDINEGNIITIIHKSE